MSIFEVRDGRRVLSGGVVRVEEESVDNRGNVFIEPLLTNGRDVKFWASEGLFHFGGVGRRTVRITDRRFLRVFLDGAQVLVINMDNVSEFELTS